MAKFILKELMGKRGVNVRNVSLWSGISPNTVSYIKNNKIHGIKLSTIQAICDTLDCSVEDIISTGKRKCYVCGGLFNDNELSEITVKSGQILNICDKCRNDSFKNVFPKLV